MRYQVEYDPRTFTLSVRELNLIVNLGSLKENMRRVRELVPLPAVLVYPYLGAVHQTDWYDIDREQLTEERVGQWTTIPWYEEERPVEEEVTKVRKRVKLDWSKQGGKR